MLQRGFNPRAREGRDLFCLNNISVKGCCFNPRAREGRDLCGVAHHQIPKRFNPRAREGRDV